MRRNKLVPGTIGTAPSGLENVPESDWQRAQTLANLLRPTLKHPLDHATLEKLAKAARLSPASVQRYRKRLMESGQVTALLKRSPGWPTRKSRLAAEQQAVIVREIERLQRQGRRLRLVDVINDITTRCRELKIKPPHRRAIDRRVAQLAPHLVERRAGNVDPPGKGKSGSYHVARALDVVQIDHTRADVMIVDDLYRLPLGRPVLSVAMDVATRCVLAFAVSFEAPSSATVAYLLTRIVAAKDAWINALGLTIAWPMGGLPGSLHLDNAPEFHGAALERGCAEFDIELQFRPPGRPHFGGHIERLIGTLMGRLKALPGATGSSVAQRKGRNPEKTAVLNLREFETWLAIEIGERYHHSEHRGLPGATPFAAWEAQASTPRPIEKLAAFNSAFLPAIRRTARHGCVDFHHIRYYHAALNALTGKNRLVVLHFDPADISKIYWIRADKTLIEIPFAQTHRPATALWEVLAATRHLRQTSKAQISEERLFRAIQKQRALVADAAAKTRKARQAVNRTKDQHRAREVLAKPAAAAPSDVDYSRAPKSLHVEVW